MGTATVQGALWGARARAWAALQESAFRPVYQAALRAAGVGPGKRLLDVGCGAGLALVVAREAGAEVSGLDASAQLVEIARERCPGADIRVGELEELPFGDESFNIVTGFNSFQYAADRVHGLEEAARVLTSDGQMVVTVWGQPENCDMAAYLKALGSLMPPPPPGAPGPWALSPPGALEELAGQAGLDTIAAGSAVALFRFDDDAEAVRGLLAAGPAIRAIEESGEQAVAAAVLESIAPFRQSDGGYELQNEFRLILAVRR